MEKSEYTGAVDLCEVSAECLRLSEELIALLREKNMKITFAESCTAGLLAATFCSVPGASEVFDGSVVSYANRIKTKLLSVPEDLLETSGAVSAACAFQMAKGACRQFGADLGLSVTGIAGPGGGTPEKPVGTVFVGCCRAGKLTAEKHHFDGSRQEVRAQSVRAALRLAHAALKK